MLDNYNELMRLKFRKVGITFASNIIQMHFHRVTQNCSMSNNYVCNRIRRVEHGISTSFC